MPEMVKGRANVFPLTLISEGFALVRVAIPPAIDRTKSLASNAPVVSAVLYVVSFKVTLTVSLVSDNVTPVIKGGCLSNRFMELFAWVLLAGFAALSKILLSTGLIVNTSFPFAIPTNSRPN